MISFTKNCLPFSDKIDIADTLIILRIALPHRSSVRRHFVIRDEHSDITCSQYHPDQTEVYKWKSSVYVLLSNIA